MQPVYPAPTDRDTFAPDAPISASGSLLEPGRDAEPSRESAAESKPKTAAEMMLAGMAGGGYQQKLLEKKRQLKRPPNRNRKMNALFEGGPGGTYRNILHLKRLKK